MKMQIPTIIRILMIIVVGGTAGVVIYLSEVNDDMPYKEKVMEELDEKTDISEEETKKGEDLLIYPEAKFIGQEDHIEITKINYYITKDSFDDVFDFYGKGFEKIEGFDKEKHIICFMENFCTFHDFSNDYFLEEVESKDISEEERNKRIEEKKEEKDLLMVEVSIEGDAETEDGHKGTLIGVIFLELEDLADMERWWE